MIFGAGAVPEGVCRLSEAAGGVSFLSPSLPVAQRPTSGVDRNRERFLRSVVRKERMPRLKGPRRASRAACRTLAPRLEDPKASALSLVTTDLALAPTHSRPRALRTTKRKGRRKGRRKGKRKGRRKGRRKALRPPLVLRPPLDFRGRASPGRGGLSARDPE